MGFLSNILQYPLTKGMDLDDPNTTRLRRQIIQEKPLLKSIYKEWYKSICEYLPLIEGPVLEIGSGAGFLEAYIPDLINSDIMPIPGNDIACDAQHLPFKNECLRAATLINVLHHISDPLQFFKELERCIKKDGTVIMIEPWVSSWSRVIYSKVHHEPFEPTSSSWILPQSGPLSGGNDALPWIIFERDRKEFIKQTNLKIEVIQEIMPIGYLLSGGVSMRNLLPGWLTNPVCSLEGALPKWFLKRTAMFAIIVLKPNMCH